MIVAFLQNQWFKDPDRVRQMLTRAESDDIREKLRDRMIHYALFAGCLTGRDGARPVSREWHHGNGSHRTWPQMYRDRTQSRLPTANRAAV
jgi:hypothetical protein